MLASACSTSSSLAKFGTCWHHGFPEARLPTCCLISGDSLSIRSETCFLYAQNIHTCIQEISGMGKPGSRLFKSAFCAVNWLSTHGAFGLLCWFTCYPRQRWYFCWMAEYWWSDTWYDGVIMSDVIESCEYSGTFSSEGYNLRGREHMNCIHGKRHVY
jgi:hypothetical protein